MSLLNSTRPAPAFAAIAPTLYTWIYDMTAAQALLATINAGDTVTDEVMVAYDPNGAFYAVWTAQSGVVGGVATQVGVQFGSAYSASADQAEFRPEVFTCIYLRGDSPEDQLGNPYAL